MKTTTVRSVKAVLALGAGAWLVACGGNATPRNGDPGVPLPTRAPARVDLTVPSGTTLTVELLDTLSSETSHPGDGFRARVVDAVRVNDRVAIEAGSLVTGRVTEAVPTKKIGGQARIGLAFDAIRLDSGDEVPIAASAYRAGVKQTKKDTAIIGGSTAGGAVLGRVIGHNRGDKDTGGTVIGAVVGGAVGTSIAATNKNSPASFREGTVIEIRLSTPVTLIARG